MPRWACAAVLLFYLLVSLNSVTFADDAILPDLDRRLPGSESDRAGFILRTPTPLQITAGDRFFSALPGIALRWDGMSGSPKWLAAPPGDVLAPPLAGSPESVARSFLERHASLYGIGPKDVGTLCLTDTVPGRSGGYHVHFRQRHRGLEVFGSHAVVNLDRDGSVRSAGSSLYGELSNPEPVLLDAVEAARSAAADVYPDRAFFGRVLSAGQGVERRTEFDEPDFHSPVTVELVVFPESTGSRTAWEVRIGDPYLASLYLVLVDARDGTVLYRRSLVFNASVRHLEGREAEPDTEEFTPDNYILETVPATTPESPSGWISGDGTELRGNNVFSPLGFRGEPVPAEPDGIYDYAYGSPAAGAAGMFWLSNELHDYFYRLGYDEQAGNMQEDNFGLGGLGGDPAQAVMWYTLSRRGGWAVPAPEGGICTLNLGYTTSLFAGDHDGFPENGYERNLGMAQDVVVHEYTHLVTARVLGGPSDVECFDSYQGYGLAEGWSNIYEYTYMDFPRSSDWGDGLSWSMDARHDMGYGDFCQVGNSGCYTHGEGMIWAATLWDLRQSMIALEGPGGREMFDVLVLEGAAEAPCRPTFLDGRDAILSADTALHGSAHHEAIWNVFASRGMGEDASTTGSGDTAPVAGHAVPVAFQCTPPSAPTGLSATATSDNVIRLEYQATGASAVEIWREDLDVPFDRPVRIALTPDTSAWEDHDVQGGRSYRYYVVALGEGGVTCNSGPSVTVDATATGTCDTWPVFDPQLQITDDGECGVTLNWSPASAGCPGSGEPIVYNIYRHTAPGYRSRDMLLIGRTDLTSFQDIPPEDGGTRYYLVLAEHGTVDGEPDHRRRDVAQIYRWVPRVPTNGRTAVHSWSFDSGPEGWTVDNTGDPDGGWTLASPHGTWYGGALLAPDEPAGGSGQSWVTGDSASPGSVTTHDSDGTVYLMSPTWDATGGETILSFDFWVHGVSLEGALQVRIDNGTEQATVPVTVFRTARSHDSPGRYGWQRGEIDLAVHIAPSATVSVTFLNYTHAILSEFGIDNVRVDRAGACARSGLEPASVTVDDTAAGWGNGNGILEPGETARLEVQLHNEGSVTAFSPIGSLGVGNRGVLVHEPDDSFPDIPAGSTAGSAGSGFTLTVPADTDCRDTIMLRFEFRDAAGTVSRADWPLEYGRAVEETVFEDDFETDKGWWTAGYPPTLGDWVRGDPVGTTVGSDTANPEDCAGGPGTSCYVTDNGLPGGPAGSNDVDNLRVMLRSPSLDLRPYKRARLEFDYWYYDSSTVDAGFDYGTYGYWAEDGTGIPESRTTQHTEPTGGWTFMEMPYPGPLSGDTSVLFEALDGPPDDVVECAVDNVAVTGILQVCDAAGVADPPAGVGDTVRVDKDATTVTVSWQPSTAGPDHDAAAYYELYRSTSADAGFLLEDTATATESVLPLSTDTAYYKVVAVNGAGSSGDEPAP